MAARKTTVRARTKPSSRADPTRRGVRGDDSAIDGYLEGASPRTRALLGQLRKTIHAIVPGAEECISYGMPAFRFEGEVIAGFAATSTGCSYYPFSGKTLRTLAVDVEAYSQTKGALHFGEPLPTGLVRKLLMARIAERKGPTARR